MQGQVVGPGQMGPGGMQMGPGGMQGPMMGKGKFSRNMLEKR